MRVGYAVSNYPSFSVTGTSGSFIFIKAHGLEWYDYNNREKKKGDLICRNSVNW